MKSITLIQSMSLAALLMMPLAGHAQVTSGQTYRLASACDTSKYMTISNSSLSDNAPVVLEPIDLTKTSQVFKFVTSGSGYTITAQNSGKVLNIANASSALKAILEQYKYTAVPSENFKVSMTSDGYYRLQNTNSGLFVNLVKAMTVPGTPFEQYSDTTACAEKFKLTVVAAPAPAPAPSPSPSPAPSPSPSPSPTPTTGTRDPLQQPFASNSIWNMPIGSGAAYKAANLSPNPGNNIWANMPGADEEYIILTPDAPLVNVNYSSAAWSGASRCNATGGLLKSVPMPSNFLIPNNTMNNSSTFLLADHRTLVQMQPLARCTAGGPATALVTFNNVDLYGNGIEGAHGGSRLSAIGGSIRLGELRPGTSEGPHHALKVNVYAKEVLYRCSLGSDCFRWPALTHDSYAVGWYGTANNNSNADMKMGALLAIPASVNIANLGLETMPAKQLAWTLQNYGAYIVDDNYAPGFTFNVENSPNGRKVDEFQKDWGFAFSSKVNYASTSAWTRDIQRLMTALNVVSNNSASAIGGGGTPRQPLAPAIAP